MSDYVKVPEKCMFCEDFHRCKLIEQRSTDICPKKRNLKNNVVDDDESFNSTFFDRPSDSLLNIQKTQKEESKRKNPPVSIGNIHRVKITESSNQGTGIARIKGYDIFVYGAKTGDTLKVKITKVTNNHAFAVKADENAKSFLTTKEKSKRKNPPVSIGDVHRVKITEKSHRGTLIARIKGFVIFVHGAKFGDDATVEITKVANNHAFAVKTDENVKQFLTNNGPVVPISISTSVGSELKYGNPWSSSGNKRSHDGSFSGRCRECGGDLVWDAKQHCSYCIKCGLEG